MIEYALIAALAVNIFGSLVYARDTLRGDSKPNRVTFLLWTIAPLTGGLITILVHGISWSVLPVIVAGLCPGMILLASFVNKSAYWQLGPFDYTCGLLSLGAFVLWQTTHWSALSILFAISSDALASIPTFRKSWTHPETETPIAYVGGALAPGLGLFTIQSWTFTQAAFPVYLFVCATGLFSIIYWRRYKLRMLN